MSDRSQILIICGLPGSGKSAYGADLERRGWARLCVDEPGRADPVLAGAWTQAFNGQDDDLIAVAALGKGVIIEWGFHPVDLHVLEAMINRGFVAWYFDGDPGAALEGWQEAHPGDPARVWHDQAARLDRSAPRIRSLFGARWLLTVGPGRAYIPIAEIDRVLGIASE